VAAERGLHGLKIGLVAVNGDLDQIDDAVAKIVHKDDGRLHRPVLD
jgi:hypothetical protein